MHPTKGDQMSDHFIKNIEIKNFKCFEDFKAEGFGRVNLIGGKNNVGKTAFMEAVYVNVYAQTISSFLTALIDIKSSRDTLDILDDKNRAKEYNIKESIEYSNTIYTKSNINETFYQIENKNGIKKYIFKFKDNEISVNINDFSFELEDIKNIRYIDNLGLNKSELKNAFITVQLLDKEEILYKYINDFDNSVLNFKIIGGDIPQCKSSNGIYRELNQFGDGLKHFISILCSLYECSGGYLFIDEIENGIHYTKLELFWEAILTIADEQNVQIFATIHSSEAISSYIYIAKRLKNREINYIKISKVEESKRVASSYDYDMLEYSFDDGHEVRGW